MFGRQGFANPFQFQPFTAGINPFVQMTGFGAINPGYPYPSMIGTGFTSGVSPLNLISPLMGAQHGAGIPAFSPYFSPYVASPIAGIHTGGFNPLAAQLGGAFSQGLHSYGSPVNPWLAAQAGVVPTSQINPLAALQNPLLLQQLAGQGGIGLLQSQGFPGSINPLTHSFNVSGSSGFSDPFTTAILAQQLNPLAQQFNPLAQSQLPIRPLISPQQEISPSPWSGYASPLSGQATDPYTALAQAQWASPLTLNPLHQVLRGYGAPPWAGGFGIPSLGVSPFSQCGYVPGLQ